MRKNTNNTKELTLLAFSLFMLKTMLIIIALMLIAHKNKANAQLSLRHVAGIRYVGASAAFVPDGLNLGVYYGWYLRDNLGVELAGLIEQGNAGLSDYSFYYVQPSIFNTFYNINQSLFLSGKLGVMAGKETVNNEILNLTVGRFIYGITVGAKAEYFITNRFKFDVEFAPRFIPQRQTGALDYKLKIGVAYNF